MRKINKKKLIIGLVTVVVISLVTGMAVYLNTYYHSENVASALTSTEDVDVSEIEEGYFFDGSGTEKALVFYPGGKVEACAYAPMMQQIAAEGIDCFLVEMPANLAVFGVNKAEKISEKYAYDTWYMAGHSLGGAMAAKYTKSHPKDVSGLVLLGAYSTEDISKSGIPVLVMYGENDQVMNRENYEKYKENLPPDATIIEIPGGNHGQFGNYGEQKGDGEATISAAEQQAAVAEQIFIMF